MVFTLFTLWRYEIQQILIVNRSSDFNNYQSYTGETIGKYNKRAVLPVHRIDNIAVALNFLAKKGIVTVKDICYSITIFLRDICGIELFDAPRCYGWKRTKNLNTI